MANQSGHNWARWVTLGGGLALFAFVVWRTAWVCDDAYISFRTIDNFVHGLGLRYNIVERVCTFTNPLWVLLMSPVYAITREIFFTSLFFSIAVSVAAYVVVVTGVMRSTVAAVFVVAVLCFSKSFVDFSTSGLENPLTHLCLAVFVWVFLWKTEIRHRLFWLSLVASLGVLNRMDSLLLYAPALAACWWPQRSWKTFRTVCFGFAPFIVWELFATVYYGFPFPNTFYAKTTTGVPAVDLAAQGLLYLVESAKIDPLLVTIIGASLVVAAVQRSRAALLLSAGIVIYLLYVIKVGGDFMAGRFLTAPFIMALGIFAQAKWPKGVTGFAPAAVAVAIGFMSPAVPILCDAKFGEGKFGKVDPDIGIIDERAYYFQYTGLLNYRDTGIYPNIIWAKEGKRLSRIGNQAIIERSIGFRAWFAGPQIHVCDMYALVDPLMARLPCETRMGWRIGHFMRTAPEGYEATLAIGQNSIADDSLRVFLDRLWTVVRGPIFSWDRLAEMIRFNFGLNQHLVRAYTDVPLTEKRYSEISTPVERGTPVKDPRVTRISRAGLKIQLEREVHATRLELGIEDRDNYFLQFRRESHLVGSTLILLQRIQGGGIRVDSVAVPDSVVSAGYDEIEVSGVYGDDRYYVGFVRLLD